MALFGLFGGRKPAPPATPEGGGPIYAIGDTHGRADVLADLLARITADAGGRPHELIFLGDYVDRGPDSRGVIDQVLAAERPGVRVTALKGNHEEAMQEFLADASFGPVWAQHGGNATLASYGVRPPANRMDDADWQRAQRDFTAALPPAHRAFIDGLQLYVERGGYLFVHAGVRPGVPLDEQVPRDLLWIRKEFLNHGKRLPQMVVHGHTPEGRPSEAVHRIGVDTGAYYSGRLTAVRLEGEERRFIQAQGSRGEARHSISGISVPA